MHREVNQCCTAELGSALALRRELSIECPAMSIIDPGARRVSAPGTMSAA